MLPLRGAWVLILVREIGSSVLSSVEKKKYPPQNMVPQVKSVHKKVPVCKRRQGKEKYKTGSSISTRKSTHHLPSPPSGLNAGQSCKKFQHQQKTKLWNDCGHDMWNSCLGEGKRKPWYHTSWRQAGLCCLSISMLSKELTELFWGEWGIWMGKRKPGICVEWKSLPSFKHLEPL